MSDDMALPLQFTDAAANKSKRSIAGMKKTQICVYVFISPVVAVADSSMVLPLMML